MFELSVIPIFRIIMGWGYQSERLNASLSLIFYTLTASIPLLLILLWRSFNFYGRINLININRIINKSNISLIRIFCFLIAFAVKLPIFGVHVWLPKAHVEAPVFGSIALAAILLKLGSYGLWVFIPSVYSFKDTNIWISIRLIGRVIVRALCIRLTDLKIIIAYSSVGHIGLVFIALIINNHLGRIGGLLLILAHGVRSSRIFLISFYMYKINYSRSLLLTKGILIWSRAMPLFWFLVLITNIAAPPTFNLISEILVIRRTVIISKLNILPLIFTILLGTAYSLIIYRSSVQRTSILFNNNNLLHQRDALNIFNHLAWGFIMTIATTVANF